MIDPKFLNQNALHRLTITELSIKQSNCFWQKPTFRASVIQYQQMMRETFDLLIEHLEEKE